ncbi:MAG: hypothetical protein K2J20_06095, partial [Bacilli bacterium]|nr:hypothetical protein [Bacilli bacterium]
IKRGLIAVAILAAAGVGIGAAVSMVPAATLATIPAAIQGVAVTNFSNVAIAGASALGTLAVTKGRDKIGEYGNNLIESGYQGKPHITETDYLNMKSVVEYEQNKQELKVSEEELDALDGKSMEEQIEIAMKKVDEVEKRIDARVARLNEARARQAATEGREAKPSGTYHPDYNPDAIKREPATVVEHDWTILSSEQVMKDVADRDVIMAQLNNYIDEQRDGKSGREYSTSIRRTTGVDLYKFNVITDEGAESARKTVEQALNALDKDYVVNLIDSYLMAIQNDNEPIATAAHDIILDATGVDVDSFNLNDAKDYQIVKASVEAAMDKKHANIMANLIFAQADNYLFAKEKGLDTMEARDAVFRATGVDLDSYDFNIKEDQEQANLELISAIELQDEELISQLKEQVAELQRIIDAGTASHEKIKRAEKDKKALLERIGSLKENKERGR